MTVTKIPTLPAAGTPVIEASVRNLPVAPQSHALALFDELDEEAIIAEIQGAAPDRFAYEIEIKTQDGPRKVIGLGKVGVDMLIRKLSDKGIVFREVETKWEDKGEYATFEVTVQRCRIGKPVMLENGKMATPEVALETHKGYKLQSKTTTTRDGRKVPNNFWFEVGFQKATRNAHRRFLPEEQVSRMIRSAIDDGKFRKFDASGKEQPVAPAKPEERAISLNAAVIDVVNAYGKAINDENCAAVVKAVSKGKLGWPLPAEIAPAYEKKVRAALEKMVAAAPKPKQEPPAPAPAAAPSAPPASEDTPF